MSIKYHLDIEHHLYLIDTYFDMYQPIDYTYLKFLPTLRLPLDRTDEIHVKELKHYQRIGGVDQYISSQPYLPWRCVDMVKTVVLEEIYNNTGLEIFKVNYLKSNFKSFVLGLEREEIIYSYLGDIYLDHKKNINNILRTINSDFICPIIDQHSDESIWDIDYNTNFMFLVNTGNIYKYRYKELL